MEIKTEHIKPNLLKLLEENNCVEAFLENAKYSDCELERFRKRNDTNDGQLLSAFIWCETEQEDLWIKINNKLPND